MFYIVKKVKRQKKKCLVMVIILKRNYSFLKKKKKDICSSGFQEFLSFLGDEISLKGFQGFRGGLDVKCILS